MARKHLHSVLDHDTGELKFTFCNLDNFFEQSSPNFLLQLADSDPNISCFFFVFKFHIEESETKRTAL